MLTGLLCALGAGMMWGLVFIAPTMLSDYPSAVLAFGRYLAFGVISLLPAFIDRRRILRLTRAHWWMAVRLSLVGNVIYYLALSTAIQLAGTPLCAMIIGTLPIVISVCSNWSARDSAHAIAWRKLLPALCCIGFGLALVNWSERNASGEEAHPYYVPGALVCLIALAAWTWYPIVNARHLQRHPELASSTWATAQGLTILPLALTGYALYGLSLHVTHQPFAFPLGPRPAQFIGLMCAIGLLASWAGTLLWNKASQKLPTALSGQLIVFETLSALAYAFIWRGSWPTLPVLAGAALLCAGVSLGMRAFRNAGQAMDSQAESA